MLKIISFYFILIVPTTNCQCASAVFGANSADVKQAWVSEAEKLLGKLVLVGKKLNAKLVSPEGLVAILELKNERRTIILKLWEITGAPPVCSSDTLLMPIARNISYYRNFIEKNKDLSPEALHRIGLRKCEESLQAITWYEAWKYIKKTAALSDLEFGFMILTNPPGGMLPLTKGSYKRLSKAYSLWLKSNIDQLVWDSKHECFRPRNGTYVNNSVLHKAFDDIEIDIAEVQRSIRTALLRYKEGQKRRGEEKGEELFLKSPDR